MVAAAGLRPRILAPLPPRRRRNKGVLVLVAVPAILALTFVWQVGSNMFRTEAVVRQAVAVGQVTLEPDPAGTRVDFVLVDRVGQETAFTGQLDVSLREPDGAIWQISRSVGTADFGVLADDSLLAGRTGYSLLVNAGDWARPPRRGGLATVSINATPSDGGPRFSTQSQQRFP